MARKRRIIRLRILEDKEDGKVCLIILPWTFWLFWKENKRFYEIIQNKQLTAIIPEPRIQESEITQEKIVDLVINKVMPIFNVTTETLETLNYEIKTTYIERLEGGLNPRN